MSNKEEEDDFSFRDFIKICFNKVDIDKEKLPDDIDIGNIYHGNVTNDVVDCFYKTCEAMFINYKRLIQIRQKSKESRQNALKHITHQTVTDLSVKDINVLGMLGKFHGGKLEEFYKHVFSFGKCDNTHNTASSFMTPVSKKRVSSETDVQTKERSSENSSLKKHGKSKRKLAELISEDESEDGSEDETGESEDSSESEISSVSLDILKSTKVTTRKKRKKDDTVHTSSSKSMPPPRKGRPSVIPHNLTLLVDLLILTQHIDTQTEKNRNETPKLGTSVLPVYFFTKPETIYQIAPECYQKLIDVYNSSNPFKVNFFIKVQQKFQNRFQQNIRTLDCNQVDSEIERISNEIKKILREVKDEGSVDPVELEELRSKCNQYLKKARDIRGYVWLE